MDNQVSDYKILLEGYGEIAKEKAELQVLSVKKELEIRQLKEQVAKLEEEIKELKGEGVNENGTE